MQSLIALGISVRERHSRQELCFSLLLEGEHVFSSRGHQHQQYSGLLLSGDNIFSLELLGVTGRPNFVKIKLFHIPCRPVR